MNHTYFKGTLASKEKVLFKCTDEIFIDYGPAFKLEEISAVEFLVLQHKYQIRVVDLDVEYVRKL
jgi:hypothetical protein